jgi:hypothetical protein
MSNTTTTIPTIESFTARVPFGSLTNYGIFDRFEQWLNGKTYAVFKTKNRGTGGWPIKGESLTALDAKLIGGDFTLDKVQVTTPEAIAQRNKESMEAMSAFYEARPDLLID